MNCPNCNKPTHLVERMGSLLHECGICGFTAPKNTLRINEIYAYVSVDPNDDNEGIIAFNSPRGPMPMVGADPERMKSMRHIAEHLAQASGVKVRLLKFSVREELETLG